MLGIAIVCALFAAAMNAAAAMLQRQATGQAKANQLFKLPLLTKVLTNKLWLAGVGLEIAAFFTQAIALYNGPLVLVAPLLTTDLVFLFAILHFKRNGNFSNRDWTGVVLLIAGLSCLLVVANPDGGYVNTDLLSWAVLSIAVSLIVISGAIWMRRSKQVITRTAIAGITAGIHFSLTAAITKLVVEQLGEHGAVYLFGSWELYLLAFVGITSAITVQSMYGAGPLVVSQPALEITEVIAGILVGVLIFGESVTHTPIAVVAQTVSGLVLCAGIILMGSSRSIVRRANR